MTQEAYFNSVRLHTQQSQTFNSQQTGPVFYMRRDIGLLTDVEKHLLENPDKFPVIIADPHIITEL